MENKLVKQILVTPSMCDFTGRLGTANVFALFMDIASEHAEMLGLGGDAMFAKGLFWITAKTKVRIYRRPRIMSTIRAETWPDVPRRAFCDRYYRLSDEKGVTAEGRTVWAVMNIAEGRLGNASELYPAEIVPNEQPVCADDFRRISRDFSECDILGEYKVRSTDIDIGNHMNNAAYVRALMGFLSRSCQSGITEAEINFTAQCFEGDVLSVRMRRTDDGGEYAMLREDGTPAVLAYIAES